MKSLNQSQGKTRRKYDAAFKLEAVRNWISSGKTAEVVARELGLSPDRLFAWRRLLPPAAAGGGAAAGGRTAAASDLRAQLEEALRENRHLREQRDILKKTLGILSEPSRNASNGFTR